MNKQQLASKIWESANKMRSKIEANEYKDYILGFMFYKFLSDKEVKWLKETAFFLSVPVQMPGSMPLPAKTCGTCPHPLKRFLQLHPKQNYPFYSMSPRCCFSL